MSKASRQLQRNIENAKYELINEWYLEHDFSGYFVKPASVPDSARFVIDDQDGVEIADTENKAFFTLYYRWNEDKVSFEAHVYLQIEYDCVFTYENQLPVSVNVTITNYKIFSEEEYNAYWDEFENADEADEDDDMDEPADEIDEADEPGDALEEDE